MFSRQPTTDESPDDGEGRPESRRALVPAVLAGLLAIAGAFLLVTYLGGNNEVAQVEQETRQVLVVTNFIEQGTPLSELLDQPLDHMAARSVPVQFAATNAISSVDELDELGDVMLASDALPGEQLSTNRFVPRVDFGADTFIDREAAVELPENHHTVVLNLPAQRALGGNIRAGDLVSVVSSFRAVPRDADPFDMTMIVLPAVEVIDVAAPANAVGQVSSDTDSVGVVSVGEFAITLAVETPELVDLAFTMEHGKILLAAALDGATNDGPRTATVLDSILAGARLDEAEIRKRLNASTLFDPSVESSDAAATDRADRSEAADGEGADALPDSGRDVGDPPPQTQASVPVDERATETAGEESENAAAPVAKEAGDAEGTEGGN